MAGTSLETSLKTRLILIRSVLAGPFLVSTILANLTCNTKKNNYCLAFEDLGISSNYQNFIPVDNYHKKTRGSYRNMFNLVDGVITGEDNHSPDYHIQRSKKEKQAPPLKQWSDLVFIDYQELQHQTRQTGEKIEHFIRNSIENKETLDVIRAARNDGLPNGPEQNPPELSLKLLEIVKLVDSLTVG